MGEILSLLTVGYCKNASPSFILKAEFGRTSILASLNCSWSRHTFEQKISIKIVDLMFPSRNIRVYLLLVSYFLKLKAKENRS